MKRPINLILLFFAVSCGMYDAQTPLQFTTNEELPVRAEEVNFKTLERRVLPKCIGCHKDWTSEEIVNRFTKENDPENSRLFVSVQKGEMPKNSPPLNSVLLEILRNYVSNIQYKRPVEEPLPDDGRPVNFATLNEKVFAVSCLPCHGGKLKDEKALLRPGKDGKFWVDQQNPSESKLLTSVLAGKMPKQRNILSDNQVELIRRYLRNFHSSRQ